MGKNLIGPYITDEVLESQYRREGSSIWVFFFFLLFSDVVDIDHFVVVALDL